MKNRYTLIKSYVKTKYNYQAVAKHIIDQLSNTNNKKTNVNEVFLLYIVNSLQINRYKMAI